MPAGSILSGWVGGIVGCGVGYPFDTVKTLMQFDPKTYPTAMWTFTRVAKEKGLRSFFRGSVIPLLGVGVIYAVGFFTYDGADALLRRARAAATAQEVNLHLDSAAHSARFGRIIGDAFLCGGVSGIFMSLLEGPAELIKIRQQATLRSAAPAAEAALPKVVRRIYRENGRGMRNFATGLPATLARDVPGSAIWFAVYEGVRYAVCRDHTSPSATESLVAGGTAGVVMWTTMMPVDVAKTVQQSTPHAVGERRPSLVQIGRQLFKQKGLRGIYAGVGPAVARAFAANGSTFAARDAVERFIHDPAPA